MATFNSDQLAQLAANSSDTLKPAEINGRVRVASFSYTVPTATVAGGETVALCTIPAGATIIGGKLAHDGLGNTIAIGVSDNVQKYLGNTSAASAGVVDIAGTIALKAGQRVTSATTIVACAVTGAWTAAKVLRGAVLYCVD